MPAITLWVARCRGGGHGWFDVDIRDYMTEFHDWPESITDGSFVWERAKPKWPGAALPLRVVKDRVVLLYPSRRPVNCCDVVDVAEALGWPLEHTIR
jgi:hypothetical protein